MYPLPLRVVILQVCPIHRYLLDSLAKPLYSDSYLRIVDFSDQGDSSKDSIDITFDKITTPIRLPDNVPRLEGGVLWISDGVMHMLPGSYPQHSNDTADEFGNIIPMTTLSLPDLSLLTNRVWNFDLKSQKWDVQVSGVEDNTVFPAIAFITTTEVGWYYGGRSPVRGEHDDPIGLHDLYHLDKGKDMPIKVETDSSLVGTVVGGELVYIEGVGKAGILVLIGGDSEASLVQNQAVSMMNQW